MTDEVGDLRANRSVYGESDTAVDDAGNIDISEGDSLSDKEGARGDVGLQSLQSAQLAVSDESLALLKGICIE